MISHYFERLLNKEDHREQNANKRRSVAYFSMEISIDERICTYSGGLGILAEDTIRSGADLRS